MVATTPRPAAPFPSDVRFSACSVLKKRLRLAAIRYGVDYIFEMQTCTSSALPRVNGVAIAGQFDSLFPCRTLRRVDRANSTSEQGDSWETDRAVRRPAYTKSIRPRPQSAKPARARLPKHPYARMVHLAEVRGSLMPRQTECVVRKARSRIGIAMAANGYQRRPRSWGDNPPRRLTHQGGRARMVATVAPAVVTSTMNGMCRQPGTA